MAQGKHRRTTPRGFIGRTRSSSGSSNTGSDYTYDPSGVGSGDFGSPSDTGSSPSCDTSSSSSSSDSGGSSGGCD